MTTTKREPTREQLESLAVARQNSIRTRKRNRLEKMARELHEAGYTVIRPCDPWDEEGSIRTALAKIEYAECIFRQMGLGSRMEELEKVEREEPGLLPMNNAQHFRDETGPDDLFSPEYLATIDVSHIVKRLHRK